MKRLMRYYILGTIWLRLAIADIGLNVFPGQFYKRLSQQKGGIPEKRSEEVLPSYVMQVVHDVRCVAGHPLWFNMSCLRRSIVLHKILKKQGITTSIIFGVRKGTRVKMVDIHGFKAHAWLVISAPQEYAGIELDPTSTSESYERLHHHG